MVSFTAIVEYNNLDTSGVKSGCLVIAVTRMFGMKKLNNNADRQIAKSKSAREPNYGLVRPVILERSVCEPVRVVTVYDKPVVQSHVNVETFSAPTEPVKSIEVKTLDGAPSQRVVSDSGASILPKSEGPKTITAARPTNTNLTLQQQQLFTSCEAVIGTKRSAPFDIGACLKKIRDGGLYRNFYKTFSLYCCDRWGFGRAHAYRLMDAAEVFADLSPFGDTLPKPITEAQCRPLSPLSKTDRPKAWHVAVKAAAGTPISNGIVSRSAEPFLPEHIRSQKARRRADLAKRKASRALNVRQIENGLKVGEEPEKILIIVGELKKNLGIKPIPGQTLEVAH